MQTEDSGIANPHLFTHLFHGGVILSSRKLDYDAQAAEDVVRALMQAQHKAVLKGLRRGEFDDKIDAYLGNHPDLQPRETGPAPESALDQPVPGAATPGPAPETAAPGRAQTEPDHAPPVHTPAPRVAEPVRPVPPVNPGQQTAVNRPASTSGPEPGRNRRASTEINPVVPPPRPAAHPVEAKPPPAARQPAAAGPPAARRPAMTPPPRPRRPAVAPPAPPRSVPTIPRRHQTTQPGIGKSSPNLDIPRQSTRGNVLVSRPPIVVESNSRITPPPPPPPPAVRAARIPPARTVREEPQDGIFEQNLISEKSLDEVILAYLSEDGSDD